eukprot:symbB.v1.2.027117.t1/scaffold2756.1/size127779/10
MTTMPFQASAFWKPGRSLQAWYQQAICRIVQIQLNMTMSLTRTTSTICLAANICPLEKPTPSKEAASSFRLRSMMSMFGHLGQENVQLPMLQRRSFAMRKVVPCEALA